MWSCRPIIGPPVALPAPASPDVDLLAPSGPPEALPAPADIPVEQPAPVDPPVNPGEQDGRYAKPGNRTHGGRLRP
jgi:hypothetical protein